MAKKISLPIQDQEALEERFSFISDDLLRSNIAIAFRYVSFLVLLESEYDLPGAISYSIYKNIILYTATIIESCLHYTLSQYIKAGKIDIGKTMPWEWAYSNPKILYKISSQASVIGVIRKKKGEKFSKTTQFKTINKILLDSSILTKSLFSQADQLRTMRNRIHLAGLKETDNDFYEKKDIDKSFYSAKKIIDHLEIKIEELNLRTNIVNIPKGTTKTTLLKLNRLLQNNKGDDQVKLIFQNGHGNRELNLPFGINYIKSLKIQINDLLNIDNATS